VAAVGNFPISKVLAGRVSEFWMVRCLQSLLIVIAIKKNYPSEPFPGLRNRSQLRRLGSSGFVTAVIIVGGVLCPA